MIHLRTRQWGTAEWTDVILEGELEGDVAASLESALGASSLHLQRLSDDNEWEDLNG